MALYKISQFGKQTIRYTFKSALKVMNDRNLLRGDKGLLRIYCKSLDEGNQHINSKFYNPIFMHIYAEHEGNFLIYCYNDWYLVDEYFNNDFPNSFFESKYFQRNNKLNLIGI